MIKTKLFMHKLSPTEETDEMVDEQINNWVEETGNIIIGTSMTSSDVGEMGREIVRVLVRYKEADEFFDVEDGGELVDEDREDRQEYSGEKRFEDEFDDL